MITVHHLERSRSHRILWLLEELQVPYEIRIYKRDAKTLLAPPELKKIHPLGKSPVISDGGRVVAESGAIIEYLVDKYGAGKMRPQKDSQELLDYRYFLHSAEGSYMPPLVMSLVFNRIPEQPMPFFIKPVMREISKNVHNIYLWPLLKENFKFLESHLQKNTWFAGSEFSAADIQMSFPIMAAHDRMKAHFQYPRLQDFLKKIQSRKAFQAALEKGGPIEL